MKLQGWNMRGADSVLNMHLWIANNEWDQFWVNRQAA